MQKNSYRGRGSGRQSYRGRGSSSQSYSYRGSGRPAHSDNGGVAAKCADITRVIPRQVPDSADSDNSAGTVVGRCTDYCPAREVQLRVRERLLHRYEVGSLRPVKEYSRPAAGQAAPGSDTVRTPDTLLDCVKYLVREVLGPRVGVKEEQLELYDFVFDRLRAVRQDLVVQGAKDTTSMVILSICVR